MVIKNDFEVKKSIGVHIEVKKEASKRPWVAGFVYLGRFRRRACPSLRRIDAVTCQRKQADEFSENAHVWRWRNA